MYNQLIQNQKLIIVPSSKSSYPLFWAEKWTDNGQKRKIYCPLSVGNDLPLTARQAYSFFKDDEIHHCQCSDKCVERMRSELRQQSIVIVGCHKTNNIAQHLINLICGVKLPQLRLAPNQILIIHWYDDSYKITSPPLRVLPYSISSRGLVPQ